MSGWKSFRMVVYGVLLGTAGVKILSSKDAKKAYTHVTAAVLRGVDEVVRTAEIVKENCEDIAADAQEINEKRYAEERERDIADAKAFLEEAEAEEAAAKEEAQAEN